MHQLEASQIDLLSKCSELISNVRPTTSLSRKEFEDIQGSGTWSIVCKAFHNETGDPLNKSDECLQLMQMVCQIV